MRWRNGLHLRATIVLSMMLASLGASPAARSSPTNPPSTAPAAASARADTVKAVVVRSWGRCSGASLVWDDLNANWSSFGSIPIVVDYADPRLCSRTVTYDALVASGADVMIISDPCGTVVVYSQDEMDAISRYAAEGHNVIGTYLLFGSAGCSNIRMAPLFGFRVLDNVGSVPVVRPYRELDPGNPLFRNLPNPYASEGYPFTQIPPDGRWSGNESNGAVYVAKTGVGAAVISVFSPPTYSAIHISSMPEFEGGIVDEQFLYNAITYPSTGA